MRKNSTVTLKDIAREVGVTPMTVSVVLNGAQSSTRVSPQTRARVQEVAARLDYRPNAVAKGLSQRLMDTLGVVAIVDGLELNLYFLEVLNGILEAAAAHAHNVTVFSLPSWDCQNRIHEFCDGRVDGLILIGSHLSPTSAALIPAHTPFLTIHSSDTLPGVCNLAVDDEAGGYMAVRHLLDAGHRRIGHFAGDLQVRGPRLRLAGCRRALADAGAVLDEALLWPGNYSVFSGREQAKRLLQLPVNGWPTAIFCASDAIAMGCLEVLHEQGIRVPEVVSLVGFDDTLTARMANPPLTTVRQPFRAMGRNAVTRLLPQIRSDMTGLENLAGDADCSLHNGNLLFDVELITRQSVGPPRNS